MYLCPMISKNKLKELAVYKQQKRCDEDSLFVVEGVKICEEVLAANIPIQVICATKLWILQHPNIPQSAQLFEVDADALERLCSLRTPNEVWMLLQRSVLGSFDGNGAPLTLALDHVQDPGNLGSIIRTADWFGIRNIVCSEDTVSCFNPKVIQSTMGGIFRTQVTYANLPVYLAGCGKPIYGALLDGENIWSGAASLRLPQEGAVLVIGNESKGISLAVQACVTRRVAIPNLGGTAESLNASVACAILLAELLRDFKD